MEMKETTEGELVCNWILTSCQPHSITSGGKEGGRGERERERVEPRRHKNRQIKNRVVDPFGFQNYPVCRIWYEDVSVIVRCYSSVERQRAEGTLSRVRRSRKPQLP